MPLTIFQTSAVRNPSTGGGTPRVPCVSLGIAGTAALAVLLAPAARADLKIIAQVTNAGQTSTSTTYYKGQKLRNETGGRQNYTVFNAGKMFFVNPATKTYRVMNLNDAANSPFMAMLDIKSNVTIKPGGKTKTILGKPTKNYVFTAVITMNMKKEAMAQMAARNGGKPPTNIPASLGTITMTGEEWVTEAVALPPGAIANEMGPMSTMPGFKSVIEKFRAIKGVALESTITMKMSGAMMNRGGAPQQPSTIKSVAKSLSEAPVPDSLFAVPTGYTEQPMFNGMGAAGRPGGGAGMPSRPPAGRP